MPLYNLATQLFSTERLSWLNDPIVVVPTNAGYVFDADHRHVAELDINHTHTLVQFKGIRMRCAEHAPIDMALREGFIANGCVYFRLRDGDLIYYTPFAMVTDQKVTIRSPRFQLPQTIEDSPWSTGSSQVIRSPWDVAFNNAVMEEGNPKKQRKAKPKPKLSRYDILRKKLNE